MSRHCLTDEQWSLIADLFPAPKPMGRPPIDRRRVINGILWILRTGAPWRDLPEEFGKWSTVWDLFDAWSSDGLLDEILQRLRGSCVDAGLIDHEVWHVDGTIVRAARCAGGGGKTDPREPADHALGRSRGGFSTKIHVICDNQGHPLSFTLTAGQTHESQALLPLLENADAQVLDLDEAPVAWPEKLAGDKAYRADWIDETLQYMEIQPVIPSKANEDRTARAVEFDATAYRQRNIIERLIGWLKENRRIFSRFEKTALNFSGMIKMAFIHRYLTLATPSDFSDKA